MYWFELSPEAVEWGLGLWGINREAMDVLREQIATKPREVRRILNSCQLGGEEEPLKLHLEERYRSIRPPAGLSPDLALLYPVKTLHIIRTENLSLCYRADLPQIVARDFTRLAPLYHLLRRCADEGKSRLQG